MTTATATTDASVQELQDATRGKAGVMLGERWRAIEGTYGGVDALLFQYFTGGRVWETKQAFARADGLPLIEAAQDPWHNVGAAGEPAFPNNWVNYGAPYPNTRFRKIAGVVYVQIAVKNGTATTTIFTLPAGYRPSGNIIAGWHYESNGDLLATINVTSAGVVSFGGQQGSSGSFANFSFPADQ